MSLTLGGSLPGTDYRFDAGFNVLSPRQTPQQTNEAPTILNSGALLTANGAVIPLAYGRVPVQGQVIAQAIDGTTLVMGVGWCWGEILNIESVFVNNEPLAAGIEVRHYKGTTTQGIDPWLAAAITDYEDTLVYTDQGETIGAAYSVFRISTSAISGVPNFQAIIQAKLIDDPRAAENFDPFYNVNGLNVDFQAGGTDEGVNEFPIILNGGATVDSVGLNLSGAGGDYASILYEEQEIATTYSTFCLELVGTSTTIAAGDATLFSRFARGSDGRTISIQRSGASMLLYLSSTGTSWDIANGVDCGTITTAEFKFTLERVNGGEFVTYLDGVETSRTASTAVVFAADADWFFGTDNAGANLWEGSIQAARIVAAIRYGSEHEATAKPFADSDSYGAQTVYSESPALMWADIAKSPLYGLGADLDGVAYAADYGDEILDDSCGVDVPRCRAGLLIASNRGIEYWLDLLAQYANCIWYPWESKLRIQPDEQVTAESPSGQNILLDNDFDSAAAWTLGDGWAIAAGVATVDGAQLDDSLLSQTIATEGMVEYAVSITITDITAGSISVNLCGAEVIAAQTLAGTYYGQSLACSGSGVLDIIASVDAVATISAAYVKRSYYLESEWVRGSLSVVGPSERGTPSSAKVNYTIPADDSPNWLTGSTVKTSPLAEDGTLPFIQTVLNLPGLQNIGQANNRAVQQVQRMHNRFSVSYTTTDHGVLQRVGDAVQPINAYRGIDDPVWIQSVAMTDYGRYTVSGSKYSNIHFPDYCDIKLCSPNLPGEGTITAVSIWDEQTESPEEFQRVYNYMGVSGSEIIVWPGGRKILYSDDLGETWQEHINGLPSAPETEGFLYPSSWQKAQGVWHSHLIDSLGRNIHTYSGRSVDGGSWEYSPAAGMWNDRYTTGSLHIQSDGKMVFAGRQTNNLMTWALYDDWQGRTDPAEEYIEGPSSSNAIRLIQVSDFNYFSIVSAPSGLRAYTVALDVTSQSWSDNNSQFSEFNHQAANGGYVLIHGGASEVWRWTENIGDVAWPAIQLPASMTQTDEVSIGSTGDYWLFSGSSSTNYWELAHSESGDASLITRGPNLILPNQQTSSGSVLPRMTDIQYAENGWWVGFYIKLDGKVEVIKFQYDDGSC